MHNPYFTLTLTLTVYMFDLDQNYVCKDIQKIDGLIRQCTHSSKTISDEQKIEQTSGGGSH